MAANAHPLASRSALCPQVSLQATARCSARSRRSSWCHTTMMPSALVKQPKECSSSVQRRSATVLRQSNAKQGAFLAGITCQLHAELSRVHIHIMSALKGSSAAAQRSGCARAFQRAGAPPARAPPPATGSAQLCAFVGSRQRGSRSGRVSTVANGLFDRGDQSGEMTVAITGARTHACLPTPTGARQAQQHRSFRTNAARFTGFRFCLGSDVHISSHMRVP